MAEGYHRLTAGLDQIQTSVSTNANFQSDPFQTRLRQRVAAGNVHHLLIADDVHNLGAENARAALPDGITLCLGLSATPERHFDAAGTAAVLDYFGPILYQYTLPQAIADGHLPVVTAATFDRKTCCATLERQIAALPERSDNSASASASASAAGKTPASAMAENV